MFSKLPIISCVLLLCACGDRATQTSITPATDLDLPEIKSPSNGEDKLDATAYYKTYHGHEVEHLEKVYKSLKRNGCTNFIFYAGDSSLDNKHWFTDMAPAINGYENILVPPSMKKDIDYWMNELLARGHGPQNKKVCSIMTSVEATTLAGRDNGLLAQDKFVRDHVGTEDFLIVSIGGNDVALAPTNATKRALLALKNNPQDPIALAHLLAIYGEKTKKYVERIIEKNKPKNTIISMIYYPSEKDSSSWARGTLEQLGYFQDPKILQNLIDFFYKEATQKIKIDGARVTPLEMSKALNGKTPSDYEQLVEPSAEGGKKLAELFLKTLFGH